MNPYLLEFLRVVHILSACFWVGTAATLAFFVMPGVLTSDFYAFNVLRNVMVERALRVYVMLAMLLTIASGAWLYWNDFSHAMGQPMTRGALDYVLGGFLGVLAGIVMLFVNAPTGMKLTAVADSVGAGPPTAEQATEIARYGRKMLIATRAISVLTLGAAALMAVARYAP